MSSQDFPSYAPAYAEDDSVFHSVCLGCGLCGMICPTHALHCQDKTGDLDAQESRMPRFQPTLCLHCGSCAAICPSNTIHQPRLRQLSRDIREQNTRAMVFLCRNTLLLAPTEAERGPVPPHMPLLAAHTSPPLYRIRLPEDVRLDVVRCAHRVGARFVDKIVQRGVRHMLMLACPEQQCAYHVGGRERLTQPTALQSVYAAYGIDVRLDVRHVVPGSVQEVQQMVDDFVAGI